MNTARPLSLALLLALGLLSSGSGIGAAAQDQPAADISPEALAQIDALIAEKDSRTPVEQKIDSQLIYERRMESGQAIADGIWAVETDLPYADDGHLIVDVRARPGSGLASRLPAADVDVLFESPDGSEIRAHLDVAQVEALAADPDVIFVQPRQAAVVSGQEATSNLVAPTGQGSRSSEGDVTHLAFAARGAFHIDGSGLKIGVLSDGIRSLAASQATGDIGPVTVIGPAAPCPAANTCDEGTAMLEIIHDLVPSAQLYFASAFVSLTSFADNIRALRAAGCDIIVDDVFYFVETPFQDGQAPGVISNTNGGAVIQAVKDVTASGALYFSSAGNSGNFDAGTSGVWEGDFRDGGQAPNLPALTTGRLHSFGGQNFNLLTVANTAAPITLYWSDPLGGSSNDYDLFRLNAAGTAVATGSTNIQNGTQDPIEQIAQSTANPRIVVVKKNSAQPRFLHLNTNRGQLSIATSGTTHGHAAVTGDGAYGVAATQAGAAFPQPFNTDALVETFSSDGPRHIFYNADGTPITQGNVSSTGGDVLKKPDITAADGVSVTGVGAFQTPFFGTSAAAPHAAAIAALVKSAKPSLTAAEIRSILTSTALDIQAPGVDRDSGAGIIMARSAVMATGAPGGAFLQVDDLQLVENPGNGNGIAEAGEGARVIVTLENYGVAPATGISAALTSPTAGVTIARPSTRAYPDLAPNSSAANAAPLLLTLAGDFGCARSADFVILADYSGGTGPLSQALSIPIGVTTYSVTRTLDGTTPPASPGVATAAGVQAGRLFRDGVTSACGATKVINTGGAANPVDNSPRRYESYQFDTCVNSVATCATVTLQGSDAINLFTAAYAPTFNPNNVRQNYKGDPGSSAESRTYSFGVGGGGESFAIDVHDVPASALPSGTVYQLTVSGICAGTCDPPNHPPVARATHVTVAANATCVADASIDDDSRDADSDPLTLVQSPAAPYALGTTNVLLTATDPKGAFSQTDGGVTVLDQTLPSITCPAPIVENTAPGLCSAPVSFAPPTASDLCSNPTTASTDIASGASFPLGRTTVAGRATDAAGNEAFCNTTVTVVDKEPPVVGGLALSPAGPLWPPNHAMVDVSVNFGVTDNCSAASCVLTVSSNEAIDGSGDGNTSPDWHVVDAHHVRLRAERSGSGSGRIYTLTLTCSDAAANKTVRTATVLVPHNQ